MSGRGLSVPALPPVHLHEVQPHQRLRKPRSITVLAEPGEVTSAARSHLGLDNLRHLFKPLACRLYSDLPVVGILSERPRQLRDMTATSA